MNENTIIQTVPAANGLRSVKGFSPLRYLRKTVSEKTGQEVWQLDLRYQKLWFRLACPNGRMLLKPLHVTQQVAIYEASVFQNTGDTKPLARCTGTADKTGLADGRYIEAAQDVALSVALENAGFGIQLCDFVASARHVYAGSEISTTQVAEARKAAGQNQTKPISPETTAASNGTAAVKAAPQQNPAQNAVFKEECTTPAKPVAAKAESEPKPVSRQEPTVEDVPRRTSLFELGGADPQEQPSVKLTEQAVNSEPVQSTAKAEEKPATTPEPVKIAEEATTSVPTKPSETATPEASSPTPATDSKEQSVAEESSPTEEKKVSSALEQLLAATHQRVVEFPVRNAAAQRTPASGEDPMPTNKAETPDSGYTPDMTVTDIMSRMTLEEANKVVVQTGICAGWTLEQVARDRTPSLRFYVNSDAANNVLKAAAKIVLDSISLAKAG